MDSNKQIEKKYFYALTEAQEYDATIRLTVPLYDLLHQTIIDILKYHFGYWESNAKLKQPKGLVLDVGAGSGVESMSILKEFNELKVLAVDMAAPMKTAFEENYNKYIGGDINERVQYWVEDIFNCDFLKLNTFLNNNFQGLKRQVAVSAYCIHHFKLEKKREIYQKMYDFLDNGGILINLDLFNYESKQISKYAHHFDIEFIKNEFDNPSEAFIESRKLPMEVRMDFKEKWVVHMEQDNILDTVESQITILKEIGFSNVECVAKYFQQGLIIATK